MPVDVPGTNIPLLPHKKQVFSLVVLVTLTIIGLEVTGLGPVLQRWASAGVVKLKGLIPKSSPTKSA